MGSRSRPALPIRVVVLLMLLVAIGYAVTSVTMFAQPESDRAVVTAAWLSCFAVANGALAVFIRRGRPWARVATLILYTLSVVRDATLLLQGDGSTSTAVALVLAAVVIVLLSGPSASQAHFDAVDAQDDSAVTAEEPHGPDGNRADAIRGG